MNHTEAVKVLRKVKAYRPAMLIDDMSGQAWHEALSDIRAEDALEAVANIARRTSDWIDPSMIRTEVGRIRDKRCEGVTPPVPPAGLTQAQERDWVRKAWQRIGDGQQVQDGDRGELTHTIDVKALGRTA